MPILSRYRPIRGDFNALILYLTPDSHESSGIFRATPVFILQIDDREGYLAEVLPEVHLQVAAPANDLGGFGIMYNGGAPAVITDMEVGWE